MARFTDAELEVMRILWDARELKPQEILDRHPRQISNSTLRTFLTDLVEKGHLSRVRRGKVFYYRAKTRPESAFRLRLNQLVDAFCGGSAIALAKHLIEMQDLSAADLAELRQFLDDAGGPKSTTRGRLS